MPATISPSTSTSRTFLWDIAVFKVEDEIFRVNRHVFIENSEVFEGMYLLPSSDEGMTDEKPIVLEGYKAADFKALLTLLYPTMKDMISGKFPLTKEEWIGVLRVSRPWQMHEIRRLAIKKLATLTLTPLEKVALARDHKVSSWLIEGLTSVTLGDPELSPDALEESLGLRTAFRIASLQVRLSGRSAVSPLPSARKGKGKGKQPTLTGFSIGALHHSACFKPLFTTDYTCQSCSQVLKVKDECAVGVDNVQLATRLESRDDGSYLSLNLQGIVCGLCRNRAFVSAATCQSCATILNAGFGFSIVVDLFLGSRSLSPSTVEAAVKETFKDEIADLHMY